MKFVRFFVGLAVLAAVGFGWYWWKSGGSQKGLEALGLQEVTVPAGLEIQLLLLEGLDAGGSKVGDEVQMGVLEDVKHHGSIVIARGARAFGKVAKSRGASLAGALTNQPARLEIELQHLQLADGRKVALVNEKREKVYAFTQANTAERVEASKVDRLWDNEAAKKTLTDIKESVLEGKALPDSQKAIAEVLEDAGLNKSKDLATGKAPQSDSLTLEKAMAAMQSGSVGSLTGFDAVLAAQALGEIADLASSVDHKLRGVFKGRTIRATIGTPLTVKTGEPFKVMVKQKKQS
ncbi:hypothetical protein QPK87_06435 [Kamptonema cortianum]|nr:hypothetical protein [Geitlerinema splendidum]MDK3156211.1 hypothetical protein [Kamptonema cortianum]